MYGFVRVGAAAPKLRVADCRYNAAEIIAAVREASEKGVSVIVFPELCITGYSCGDLFRQAYLLDSAEEALAEIINETASLDIFIALGLPVRVKNRLYNCAAMISGGVLHGLVPKTYLANNNEFYEKRCFSSALELDTDIWPLCGGNVPIGADLLFDLGGGVVTGIEICRDLWMPVPPSAYQAMSGANIVLNLSASNEVVNKRKFRHRMISAHSERMAVCYVYSSAGPCESTTDAVYGGHCSIYENGGLLAENTDMVRDSRLIYADADIDMLMSIRRNSCDFSLCSGGGRQYRTVAVPLKQERQESLMRHITKTPFIPEAINERNTACQEAFEIQAAGLAGRITHINIKTCILAISGGLDSTLALLCTVKAFDTLGLDRKGIIGVTMPGFGTTGRTYNNALALLRTLGATSREISIKEACEKHFEDIGYKPEKGGETYGNAQARERTQIAMDIANMENGFMVGTGDLSELALGFTTYNGDHMSMYGVNAGLPKTLVRAVTEWAAEHGGFGSEAGEILVDIVNTPISPELLPGQITEDTVGPYILNDFFIYHYLKYGFSPEKILFLAKEAFKGDFTGDEILKWLKLFYKRFFAAQYKRSCMPDGPKVCEVSLSPRGDLRMPSDAVFGGIICIQ